MTESWVIQRNHVKCAIYAEKNVGVIANNEVENPWKEAAMAYFKTLFQQLTCVL
jgi:hypothetical protein